MMRNVALFSPSVMKALSLIVCLCMLLPYSSASVSGMMSHSGPLNGGFEKFLFKSLAVKSLATKRVPSEIHCSMNCQREDRCLSFNFAVTNDSVGNFMCELLPLNRFGRLDKFKTNDSFHHFSSKVNRLLHIISFSSIIIYSLITSIIDLY